MVRECSTSYHLQGGRLDDRIKLTRRAMYKRETEERSPSHFCHEKAVSFTRSECVSVALGPAYTKETGHGNVTAISKKRHRF